MKQRLQNNEKNKYLKKLPGSIANKWTSIADITAKETGQRSMESEQKTKSVGKTARSMARTVVAEEDNPDEQTAKTLIDEKLSPFSKELCKITQQERGEVTRLAQDLAVTTNTIYRWMNGTSEPRQGYLKKLLEVRPEQQTSLQQAITQTFGPIAQKSTMGGLPELHKELYHRVLELVATTDESDTRYWQIAQTIFGYALQHLDEEHNGISITFAKVMPPHKDGVHSLREVATYGTAPWPPYSVESRAYLGSTTLAGTTAECQHMQVWDIRDENQRTIVEIDAFESCACAAPILRGTRIAGVLIMASTQPGFFSDPMACQAVVTLALMLGIALSERDFYPTAQLSLRPMPSLTWQREHIMKSYNSRILTYARKNAMSRREAEKQVQQDLEREFEAHAHADLQQQIYTDRQIQDLL